MHRVEKRINLQESRFNNHSSRVECLTRRTLPRDAGPSEKHSRLQESLVNT